MIAITFALPQESAPFVAMLRDVGSIERGALPVLRGMLGAHEVMVVHHGIGAELSASRVGTLLERSRPQTLISSGFAGGLDPKMKIGDVVIAENFSDGSMLGKMGDGKAAEARAFFGTLTTQPHAAETADEKSVLFRSTGALAVDMETAGIRALCGKYAVPMLSLRAISDTASQRLPVPFPVWFDAAKQTPRVLSLLGFLATHPGRIAEFTHFARGTFRAARSLADVLAQAVEAVAK